MIPNAADVPAHIRNLVAGAARQMNEDAIAGISTGMPPRVKLSGKQFTIVDGNANEIPFPPAQMVQMSQDGAVGMPVIFLKARKAYHKQWFATAFNPNAEAQAPDCYSLDGERPDPHSLAKQSDSCAACKQNAFGSGKDQQGNATAGKACTDNKIMAAFVPGFGVNQFKIPPASLKNFALYVKQLSAANLPLNMVKTLVGFDLKSTYPVLTFAYGGVLGEAAIGKIMELVDSPETEEIITPSFVAPATKAPAQEVAPAAQAAPATTGRGKKAPAPAQQAAPAAEIVNDDMGLGLGDMKTATAAAVQQAAPAPSAAEVSDADLRAALGL